MRALAVTCGMLGLTHAGAQPAATETPERVLPLEVVVNGTAGGIWPILERGGVLYAPVEAFQNWRLQAQMDVGIVTYRGLPYLPLTAVAGLEGQVDAQQQFLNLKVAPSAFAATKLARELGPVGAHRSKPVGALFGNYDLNLAYSSRTQKSDLGAVGEVGWSGGLGVFSQTFLGQRLLAAEDRKFTRLQTSFRRDFPASGHTLTIGDAVSRSSLLGRSAYFGGIQFGSNFDLAPGLNRQPIPLVAGETATPSVVQLYVNDVLRQTSNVPAGPFTLDNLPTLVGNGQVTVKVRDILGRETLITQPFLITADLLAPGLNDWSVEAGGLRRELGITNATYGPGFVSGLWRRGLSTEFTGEGRLEATQDRQALGVAGVHTLGASWLLRAGAMASRDQMLGPGTRWLVGADRPSFGSNLSFTLEGKSREFRGLGEDRVISVIQLQLASQASVSTLWGTFGFGLAIQKPYSDRTVTTASLNYSAVLRNNWLLNTYYSRATGITNGYTLGATLTVPLERNTVVATSMQSYKGGVDFYSAATHSPDVAGGLAWRALVAQQQQEPRAEAGVYYAGQKGQVAADVSTTPGQTNLRLGASGGLLFTGGRGYALQRFDNAAALVEVPGYANIGVGVGAQAGTRTDAGGYALIPRLRPYANNPIRLDPNDLPITAEIDSIEVDAVPGWRSVAQVQFSVRGGRGALLRINFDDGEPAPPGAIVQIGGEDRQFYVARRGEAYVTGLQDANQLQLTWKGARCPLRVVLPPGTADEVTRVGPLTCTGVAR
ncbi:MULTISPECIES: fimbria/pilus outer membrane usher protein [Ramlibacter]|nr:MULTISPECIES: fimbria/pilus outer membrane usher protein [Ramlibacter]MBA2965319.1 fimbrial biogenesis outer membrane usher protein [Ramlibacter sp. CGMCC 1.13660]